MNFAFEIRRESNPRGSKPPSHTVCDLNHSTNRVIRLVPNVPISCDGNGSVPIVSTRLVEWLRAQTVWDGGLLPRGFDSLRISNAKFITYQRQRNIPRTCQSMVNTLQVDELVRVPGLTPALYKTYPQPPEFQGFWCKNPPIVKILFGLDQFPTRGKK